MFFRYYISDVEDAGFRSDAQNLQLTSALLARTCLVPATRSTHAYDLYLIDDTAVVMFHSHRQHCAAGKLPGDGANGNVGAR
jgi:hypothetical protein